MKPHSLAETDYSALPEKDREFIDDVLKYGWKSTYVFETDEEPSFIYSTGFWRKFRMPEVLIFSMPQEIGHQVLWNIFHLYSDGESLPVAETAGGIFEQNGPMFFPMEEKAKHLNCSFSDWFYLRENFDCFQMVWSDENGLFPWSAGFAERYRDSQPDVSIGGWASYLGAKQ